MSRHLILCHNLDKVTARKATLVAQRGDVVDQNSYYEDISDDDSVLDVLQDLIDADQYKADSSIATFDLAMLSSEQSGNISMPRGDDLISGGDVRMLNNSASVLGSDASVLDGDVDVEMTCSNVSTVNGSETAQRSDEPVLGSYVSVLEEDSDNYLLEVNYASVSDVSDVSVSGRDVGGQSSDVMGQCGNGADQGDNDESAFDIAGNEAVIVISDDEDNNCRDIILSNQTEKTQVVTMTFKRKIIINNGHRTVENLGCVVHFEEY